MLSAIDLLESGKFVEYTTNYKRLFKITEKNCDYYLFNNINYCNCDEFEQVFVEKLIMCRHVLSLKLAIIKGNVKKEILTDTQLTDLLNNQIEFGIN